MKKLNIELTNCHGIRELIATFNFTSGNAVAVYAPNGTMKTSFALTLADLARGTETPDHMFPNVTASGVSPIKTGTRCMVDDVVVVLSYDEDLGPTESTSTLLVNPELRKEYEALQLELLEARDELVSR